jgi:hypothetical protein
MELEALLSRFRYDFNYRKSYIMHTHNKSCTEWLKRHLTPDILESKVSCKDYLILFYFINAYRTKVSSYDAGHSDYVRFSVSLEYMAFPRILFWHRRPTQVTLTTQLAAL